MLKVLKQPKELIDGYNHILTLADTYPVKKRFLKNYKFNTKSPKLAKKEAKSQLEANKHHLKQHCRVDVMAVEILQNDAK